MKGFARFMVDPNQIGGVPYTQGPRISVAQIVGRIAEGMTEQRVFKAYPGCEPGRKEGFHAR